MNLKCKINGIEYLDIVQGLNISEEYNETLDSASIIISNVPKMDLRPYDDVYIYEGEFTGYGNNFTLPSFFLHFLVDQFTEEMINLDSNTNEIRYKYKIDLFSETKRLETIQLPNFSITQPLDISRKKSVWEYINDIVDMYNPLYKVVKDSTTQEWTYGKKYTIDSSLFDIFGQVYSPDFTLNNPNLRDVLTQLMLTKDMIPVVKNDVITAMDLTKRNGLFDFSKGNLTYITGSRSSDNHCDGLKRSYNNALSQDNTCRMVEFLGFRNSDSGMLTLENLRLETRYPIYKINKVYMCYYKKIQLINDKGNKDGERIFLCKQDISKLVKLNSERNLLSEDWVDFEDNVNSGTSLDELSQYKLSTIGYDIGSKHITGWGTKYTYVENVIHDKTKTYIENIIKIMDIKYPYGIYNYGYIYEKGNIPKGYSISGTMGNLEDRVVNVYSNLSLFMKSLFFEIDYNAFYNGTIIHSKDTDRDDIIINDNSSSSLTLLEQDGLFQKEKVNRYGNKAIQINATYYNFNDLQPLGSVYELDDEKDVIIYHREVSVNDNVINCVYYGTKDYVLKNYFTSVNAKHRPFNLMSYDESVRRSENKKMYVMLSKDKYYYENENKVLKFDTNFIEKFLSFYKKTELGKTKGNFIYSDKINYGYIEYGDNKYASDVNAFASGYSMCFNIAMYDNVSGGVYIDKDKLEPEMANVDDDYIRGSIQKWYFTSDKDTGVANNMGFYIGHIDNDNMFFEKDVLQISDESKVTDVIKNNIMALPKITTSTDNMKNVVGNYFKINKDNKELIDMTYQFELVSDSDDILFSSWALRLSDLLGNYVKFSDDVNANDFENAGTDYKVITATAKYKWWIESVGSYNAITTYSPIMLLQFPIDNLPLIKETTFRGKFEYPLDVSKNLGQDYVYENPIYYSFEMLEIVDYNETEGIIKIKGNQKVTFDGGLFRPVKSDYDDVVTLIFKRINRVGNTEVPDGYAWFSNCQVDIDSQHTSQFNIEFFKDDEIDNKVIVHNDGNAWFRMNNNSKTLVGFGTQIIYTPEEAFDESTTYQKDEYLITDENEERTIYHKNFFVTTSLEKMKKEIVYDELEKLNGSITFRPNEVFFIQANPNGNGGYVLGIDTEKLKIKTSVGNLPVMRIAKSVQLWYKDELSYENDTEGLITKGEKGYHFVFGVNLDDFIQSERYIYINISLLSKKDRRVFDEGHNLIGEIRNEAESTTPINQQFYNVKSKL